MRAPRGMVRGEPARRGRGGGERRRAVGDGRPVRTVSDLPVHRAGTEQRGDAPGPPGPVPLHGVAAEGVPVPPRDTDDGRREVHLQGRVRPRAERGRVHRTRPVPDGRQPRPLREPHHGKCARHHSVRVHQGQDLPLQRPRLRREDVPQHCPDLEGRDRQPGQRRLRVRRHVEHRQGRLPRGAGRAELRQFVPERAGVGGRRRRAGGEPGLPHPVRDRPGSLLPPHEGRRPQARSEESPPRGQAGPHPLEVLPAAAGRHREDEQQRCQLGDLPHGHAGGHRKEDQGPRLLRGEGDEEAPGGARGRPRRGR
mmetsp:Transcript_26369/g.59458  ORF Transcript_26369/g.59458 Transcript_26369/m.59458 type:complete len:310 (+) Transcript_26369:403-1332(+)